MPGAIRRANAAKSKIRARVEHVFAEQKDRMELFVRTIGDALESFIRRGRSDAKRANVRSKVSARTS